MFTGLVAELGTVQRLARQGNSYHLTVGAQKVLQNLKIGDSVAVNGACLTVVRMDDGGRRCGYEERSPGKKQCQHGEQAG